MDEADNAGLAEGEWVGRAAAAVLKALAAEQAAALGEASDEDKDSGAEKGCCHQVQASEELLDFGLAHAVRHLLFDEIDDRVTDDRGEERREHDADENAYERFGGAEVRDRPAPPEVGDDGEHGARVEHDQEERHFGCRGVESHQLLRDDDVGGARDGQQFGEALHDGEEEVFQDGHEGSLQAGGSG